MPENSYFVQHLFKPFIPFEDTNFIFSRCFHLMSRKNHLSFFLYFFWVLLIWMLAAGCETPPPPEKEIVKVPEKMDVRVAANLRKLLPFTIENKGYLNDTTKLAHDSVTDWVYSKNDYRPLWC